MDEQTAEVLVLGLGNVLRADEGFGVRALEALDAGYVMAPGVRIMNGGTQGLLLFNDVLGARRLILFDAVDYRLPPGTLKVLRDADVPAWSPAKMSMLQSGFQELLALVQLQGRLPEKVTLIGVQPEDLSDFGGDLSPCVHARLTEAVGIAVEELARWGLPAHARDEPADGERLDATVLEVQRHEADRPAQQSTCLLGDARFLNIGHPNPVRDALAPDPSSTAMPSRSDDGPAPRAPVA